MEILLAKRAGFCFGVKRATQMAFEAAGKEQKTFTLGPIIHSPQVVQKLEEMGVGVVKKLTNVSDGTVIIRSHGVLASEMEEAQRKELEIVDATCPFVKKPRSMSSICPKQGMRYWWWGMPTIRKLKGLFPTVKTRCTSWPPAKRCGNCQR